MEKKLRRLLVLLATVVLLVCVLTTGVFATQTEELDCYRHGDLKVDGKITQRDAIYLLYNVMFGEESYPVNQDCDFNGDGEVTAKDAYYLLYASFGDADCPLDKEMIHNYYEPVWSWIDGDLSVGATATLKCGCGEEIACSSAPNAENLIEIKEESKAATCEEDGYKTYTGTFTMNGQTYTSTKTYTIEADGHSLVGVWDCENGVECANCDYTVEAKGHSWTADAANSKEATCSAEAVKAYVCENCQATKSETVEGKAPHTYEFSSVVSEGCKSTNQYVCKYCSEAKPVENADIYYTHKYTATLTKEATCTTAGEKTYTCTCGDTYTEEVPADAALHVWNDGETADGVITYTCTGCNATKTAVITNANTAVSASAADELQLDNGAAVALDDATVEQLGEAEIKVSVEEVVAEKVTEELGLTEAQKEQIGDNPVYDFNMVSVDAEGNEEQVSNFDGEVTVSLPYELAEGEDIDSIDVWFIADNGELTRMDATYSNGYVTFTTTHFSYYTVTRLTAEERCARYGCAFETYEKAASCTAGGYKKVICTRCGDVQSSENYAANGHSYETITDNKPNCTETGLLEQKCSVCTHKTSEVIPALGHKINTETKEATCENPGESKITCENCDLTATEILTKLNHDYGAPEIKEATCTEGGYTKSVCASCGYESIGGETAALGHAYAVAENGWTWAEDNSAATVNLVCAHDATHTKVLDAVVTAKTVDATCAATGSTTYTATAANGTNTYTDTKTVTTAVVDHQPTVEWSSNATEHYHVCSVCNEKIGAVAHTWGAETVTKAATCTTVGTAEVACTACDYTTEKTLPATGEHTYVNGICSVCGKDETACDHLRVYKTEIDLSAYNICEDTQIFDVACDCGEKQYPSFKGNCNLVEGEEGTEVTLPDGTKVEMWTSECADCDLQIEYGYYSKVDETECAIRWYEYFKISANGTLITEGTWVSEPMEEHPVNGDPYETYDMAELGMCEGTIELYNCACGYAVILSEVDGCTWSNVESVEENGVYTNTYECTECGAVRVRTESSTTEEGCLRTWYKTYTYYVNDAAVLELNAKSGWSNHDYICESYELDGESCEDGLLYTLKCQTCGDIYESYVTGHAEILRTTVDLSNADFCADTLIQYTCPCDEQYCSWDLGYPDEDTWCEWTWSEDENGNEFIVCENCGVTRTQTRVVGEKDEYCQCKVTVNNVFTDANGNEIATADSSYMTERHNMESTIELLVEGGSCKDGVKCTNTCADCGDSYTWTEYDHMGIEQETYDLSSLNMCIAEATRYACACGESDWISFWEEDSHCDWNWVVGYEYSHTEKCANCGVTMETAWEDLEQIDTCHVKRHYTYTLTKDGVDPVVIEQERIDTVHAGQVFDLVLMDGATDCTGGVRIYMNCTVCGASEEHGTTYGHSCWPVAVETLSEGELCGTLKMETISCACGYESWTNTEWEGGQCNFAHIDYDDVQQMSTFECVECGAIRTVQTTETPVEGETCRYSAVVTTVFYDKDNNELFSYVANESGERHDYLYTFRMNGTTCEEGYYVIRTCQACGTVREYNNCYTDCEIWRTVKEPFYTTDCGEIALYQLTSPCGDQNGWDLDGDCSFTWIGWDEKLDMEIQQCAKCGQQIGRRGEGSRVSGTCDMNRSDIFVVLVDGEEVSRVEKTYTTKEHEYVYDFQMQGESCEDGYTMTAACAYCDEQRQWEDMRYGHGHYLTAYYDLTGYGLCSGEFHVYGCACGQESGWGWNDWDCDYDYIGVTDAESGLSIRKCNDTGVYYVRGEVGEVDHKNCQYTGTYYLKIFGTDYNAEPVLNASIDFSHDSHTYKATSLTLLNPEGTCEDGVTAVYACEYCGESGEDTYYWHRDWVTETLDLSEYDTCGGVLELGGCACGQSTYFHKGYNCQSMENVDSWYEEDENGIGHQFWKHVCADCGLTYVEEHYTVDDEANCMCYGYYTYTFSLNGAEIKTIERSDAWSSHDCLKTCVLAEGSATCEDGVVITRTCQRCDYTENYETEYHEVFKAEAIDLTQYGSVCGATLDHYTCACGAYERYSFSNDSACDLDYQYVDEADWWVENVINKSQYTSEDYCGAWSDFYNVKCAVSDPACGLSMKMAEYWLKDGCQVTEYQNWQILDADGNIVWEDTILTGETMGFHDYTETHIDETAEDGTRVSGYQYVCADCGSTYETLNHYDADGNHVKHEQNAINTLDNGENKEWHSYYVNGYVANDHLYRSLERTEYVRADGSIYWYQHAYTYDFTGSCTAIREYSNSNGSHDTYTEEAHIGSWEYDYKNPTCTQFGYYEEYGYCDVCGDQWDYYYEILEPTCHDWYDGGNGSYYCYDCGLESTQGASGAIVMEDLSAEYGQDVGYVVGYYNREDIEFVANVSVVLDDSTAEDNVILLEGISYTNWDAETQEVTAVYYDKATVDAAAEAAMTEAGYTGSYAIRITFVPVNYSDDLDYAITFDSLTYNPDEATEGVG